MKYLAYKPLPNQGIHIRLCSDAAEVIEHVGNPKTDPEIIALNITNDEYDRLSECTPEELLEFIQYERPQEPHHKIEDNTPVRIHGHQT